MIDLHPEYLKIVKTILKKHIPNSRVIVFGSRVTGKVKEYSDLDLCVMDKEPLSLKQLSDLREDLSESDLPIRVDIVDWAKLEPSFRKIIVEHHENIFP